MLFCYSAQPCTGPVTAFIGGKRPMLLVGYRQAPTPGALQANHTYSRPLLGSAVPQLAPRLWLAILHRAAVANQGYQRVGCKPGRHVERGMEKNG